uniref:Secreted protein n=1 Tax=Globodera pallida TaxID=36090 RepID=A0A183CAV5_GLOPA
MAAITVHAVTTNSVMQPAAPYLLRGAERSCHCSAHSFNFLFVAAFSSSGFSAGKVLPKLSFRFVFASGDKRNAAAKTFRLRNSHPVALT